MIQNFRATEQTNYGVMICENVMKDGKGTNSTPKDSNKSSWIANERK